MRNRAHAVLALALFAASVAAPGARTAWAQAVPVGPSLQQYEGYTRWPAVAYDSEYGVYLVVWGNNGTIRGLFVNDDGTPASAVFQISDPSVNAQTPRLAYSPDLAQFLVVWHSTDGVTGNPDGTRVRGRLVDFASSGPVGTAQVYSNGTYTTKWEVGPGVAYSTASQTFLVAYNIFAATGAEVGARLVDTTAAAVGAEIPVTASTADYDREPAVGYFPSTDSFAVAWSGNGTSADFVRARLYAAADGAPAGPAVTVAQSTITYVPDLAYNVATGQMLVTWIQSDPVTGGWRPFGNFLDDTGLVVGTTQRLSSTVGAYDANSVAYNVPAMTFFLVTHGNSYQDVGFEISGDGTPVSSAAVVTSVTAPNLTGSFNPRLAASSQGPGWLIATAASFSSLWTQLIAGTDLGGGVGTIVPKLTVTPAPTGGTVTGGGLTCGTGGTTCQVTFPEPTTVTLAATADAGFEFRGWGGSCTGTDATATVQVSSAKTCRASFVQVWLGPNTQPFGCPASPALAYPAAPGPIGSSIKQYSGATQYPDIAYHACQQVYLTVWSLGGTIRGRFVNEDGAGVGDTFYISTGQFAQTPKVTYNANLGTFLVTWHSSASDTRTELRSAVVTYPPGPASEGTVLSGSTYSTRWITRPAVDYATGSGRYLIGWSRYATTGAEISARMVNALGEVATDEFPVTASEADYDREPTLGYLPGANRFLVAWAGTGSTSDFVRGQLYDASSGAVIGSPIPFGQAVFTYVPEAALNATTGQLFVVWIQIDPVGGGWRPFGRFIDGNGTLLSPSAIRLSSSAGAYDANAIAYNPLSQSFFLVTHGTDTPQDVGFEIAGDGTPLGAAAPVTNIVQTTFTGAFNPRVAASRWQPRWLIGTSGSFNSLWTQLVGGRNPGCSLTISPAPTGGTVTGGEIACGTGGASCQQLFTSATTVTLTATPDPDFTFAGWGGSCLGTSATVEVSVDAARVCSAVFTSTSGTTYQLNVTRPANGTVTGTGVTCGTSGTDCTETYGAATSVTLTAAADSGYTFTGWGGSCTGTSPSTTVLMNAAKTCTAAFTATASSYALTMAPVPANGTVTGGGLVCGAGGTTCTASYTAYTSVTLTAAANAGYAFTGWGGSCTGTTPSTTVLMNAAKTCTATFAAGLPTGPPYTLTISPAPAGGSVIGAGLNCGVGGSLCSVTMPAPMTLGLQATPATGYTFTNWTGDCTGTASSLFVPLTGARTCGATFTPTASTTYQLAVAPVPANGTVTGGGLTCGAGGTTCVASFSSGTSVTLTAAATTGYVFTNWGGSCTGTSPSTTVLMNAAKTCTASFAEGLPTGPPYTMTISPKPAGGSVIGAGLNCGAAGTLCTVTMPAPMTLGLQATPATGYTFTNWTGDCTGTSANIFIPLSGARTCGATFVPSGGGAD